MVSGRSNCKQASKQANRHIHTCVQCSCASVWLTQAHPNNTLLDSGDTNVHKTVKCSFPIAIQVTHTVHSWWKKKYGNPTIISEQAVTSDLLTLSLFLPLGCKTSITHMYLTGLRSCPSPCKKLTREGGSSPWWHQVDVNSPGRTRKTHVFRKPTQPLRDKLFSWTSAYHQRTKKLCYHYIAITFPLHHHYI